MRLAIFSTSCLKNSLVELPPNEVSGVSKILNQMRKLFFIIIFVFSILYFTDSFARDLRIISLAPSTTEILFALGLDKEIVGVSQFCNYPPKALTKDKVGTFSQPSIEKILSLNPDIIFCTGLEQAPVIAKLRRLRIKVVVSDPSNMDSLFNSIKEAGRLTNKDVEAAELIKKMKTKINKIKSLTKDIPYEKRQKVFIEIWHNPLTSVGKGSFVNELIEDAGGINIAYDLNQAYGSFSPECVIKRNPDCIILAYMGNKNPYDEVKSRAGWNDIAAVKNKRVYADINSDILLRPGPRITEGLEEIYKKLYEPRPSRAVEEIEKEGRGESSPSKTN